MTTEPRTTDNEPATHGRVESPQGRSVDDWDCKCGAFGSHSWMGFSYHLLGRMNTVAERTSGGLDAERLLRLAASIIEQGEGGPDWRSAVTRWQKQYARLTGGQDDVSPVVSDSVTLPETDDE